MRTFFIDIKRQGDGVKIDVGKGTKGDLIMSRSWERNPYDSWPPTHVAFAAWNNITVDYNFCFNKSGKEREGVNN